MTAQLGEVFKKAVDIVGPIVMRELSKPRTRQVIEEKVGELATELARQRFTKKSKKIITIRRGTKQFRCVRLR